MIDDEERLALERELAAALAELNDDIGVENVDDEPTGELMGLAHHNLNDTLDFVMQKERTGEHLVEAEHQMNDTNEEHAATTSWNLLLASVTVCEREFFGAIAADINDIRDTLLSLGDQTSNEMSVVPEQPTSFLLSADTHQYDTEEFKPQLVDTPIVSSNGKGVDGLQFELPSCDISISEVSRGFLIPLAIGTTNPLVSVQVVELLPPQQAPATFPSALASKPLQPSPVDSLDSVDNSITLPAGIDLRASNMTTAPTAVDSTSWSLLAQQRWLKQQQESVQWLTQLELDVDNLEREQKRIDLERCETHERALMKNEEQHTERHIAYQREKRERDEMQIEDEFSATLNKVIALERRRETDARTEMENEDCMSLQYLGFLKQRELEEKLMKEKNKVRRIFHFVLVSLTERHRAKLVEEQKRLDNVRKREARECSLMRAEEARTRRLIAQSCAVAQEHERTTNRLAMLAEDELSRERDRFYRRNCEMERHNCHLMHEEEARTIRAWIYAREVEQITLKHRIKVEEEENARVERLERITKGVRISSSLLVRHRTHHAFKRLVRRTQELQHYEEQANRIQNWWRSCQTILDMLETPECEEDEGFEYGEQAQDAAMVVQSVFRGFFVRRKFQTAIQLAREVGDGDEDGVFGEVNLDDLIQLPPELEEGWEDPVLPHRTRRRIVTMPIPVVPIKHQEDPEEEEEEEEDGGGNEDGRLESDFGLNQARAIPPNQSQVSANVSNQYTNAAEPPKEQNLAAALWGKMMRTKQKQRKVLEERVKEQDPTYRAQKLLNPNKRKGKPAYPTSAMNAEPSQPATISWTTSSNPPKPKVKLPSLVERLRKKTAAERG